LEGVGMIAGSWLIQPFTRPTQRFWGKLNKGLGPVPPDMPDLREQEDIDWYAVPRYPRLMVLATIGAVVSIVYGMWFAFEWMRYSVVTAALLLLPINEDARSDISSGVIMIYLLLLIWRLRSRKGAGRSSAPKGLLRAAILEEQWFRSGCESWPRSKQVYSCIFFGFVHLWNLVVPVAVVVALMFGGAVMMMVYLRAHRNSGDVVTATLTSSRFHCDYNETVLGMVFPAMLVIMTAYSIFRTF
jgi:hypothetical protein